MSLFDREDVSPPQPCSRCGKEVVATSLFCPECGQSMVNPLATTAEPEPDQPETTETPADSAPDQQVQEEQKRSTLSRTTDWIIKSIQRVQAGGGTAQSADVTSASEDEPPSQSVSAVQPGLIPESSVRKTSTWPERLQQSSRAQTRFVLVGPDGGQHTLGEQLTGIGTAASPPEGEPMVWVSLGAMDTVEPFHLRCGVDEGIWWLEDNNSIHGTVIAEPGRQALQCIPYERYFVIRGSEIRLGRHFFTLQ